MNHSIIVIIGLSTLSFQNIYAYENKINLNTKLDMQWKNYKNARNYLLENSQNENIPLEKRKITREKWESLLALDNDYAFTKEDFFKLTKRQSDKIYHAKLNAIKNSLINLNLVRNKKLEKQFCEQFPKGGLLHIHPSGTLNRESANFLLEKNNPSLDMTPYLKSIDNSSGNSMIYPYERAWLENLPANQHYLDLPPQEQKKLQNFLFLPEGKQPFPRFNAVFTFLGMATPGNNSYVTELLNFVKRAATEKVIYIEFTGSVKTEMLDTISLLEKETGVTIRMNQAFRRTKDVNTLNSDWLKFISSPMQNSEYIVGIDFLDNEENNAALDKGQYIYGSAFYGAMTGKNKLRRTMHSGEIGFVQNQRDSMIMGAERLGHAVNLIKDPVALEYASIHKIPIEINISSNLRLTDINNVSSHPFLNYLRLGLPVSLSTDDEGMFDTDINNECTIAIKNTDITYYELKNMSFNSINYSFEKNLKNKESLLKKLHDQFNEFEKSQFFKNLGNMKE